MSYKVVILKTKPGALKQAEQFLRNRQWTIFATTNIRDAIASVIQNKPDFILVAADHPNKKVRMLPKLIGQAFPVRVIGFVETSSSAGMAILHDVGLEYNVFPPISGPSIERMALKIKKDDEKKELDRQKALENGGVAATSDNESMRVSGGAGEGFANAREMLNRLVNGDDQNTDDSVISSSGAGTLSGSIVQTGIKTTGEDGILSPAELEKLKSANGSTNSKDDEHSATSGLNRGHASQSGSTTADETPGSIANPYASDWSTDDEGNPLPSHGQRRPKALNPDGSVAADEDTAENSPHRSSTDPDFDPYKNSGPSRPKKAAPIMEHSDIDLHKKKPEITYKQEPSLYPDRDSILVKGTQAALDESVSVNSEGHVFTKIENSTSIACITIDSPRFSGYLVAALGKDRAIDDTFLNSVKERLFGFLKSNGEVIRDDEAMNLKLEQVGFEDWAIDQAEFLRKSVHGSDEIAMAFFPSKETSLKLEQSVSEKMLQMSIEELRDDVPVEFDLYIYLPSNQKYLLYTPQGRPLFGNQRGRLKEKGVTHMHLRKESEGQVKRYRAQVYLNGMISNFKSKKKSKPA